ncbi:hypothetical protein G436_2425 [Leptospira interrogans serovar Hardjo str. Norma]|uniref:Uncharacterized protein n=1 Tax=Leptospira interrogans serovar Hardjo str. Norma TaxID=1279460 RepID=A0A0M4MUV1_LEPIR|nr:hypothetical protein G436_2425 [Leptospira interrogans serovar Hardjo str. Norma]
MILRTNSKIVGTHTFRKIFLSRTHVKITDLLVHVNYYSDL